MSKNYKIAFNFSVIVFILAVITSTIAILNNEVYNDNGFTKLAWYGNDIVTLFLAMPIMAFSLWKTRIGNRKALLIWMGALWYIVYNYIFYLYGAAFNDFFLVYVVLIVLAGCALIFALYQTDAFKIKEAFAKRTPVKVISGYMYFFAMILGGMWVGLTLSSMLSGSLPPHIVKTGHITAVVYATDLTFLVPFLLISATLLWRKKPWGYVLSPIILVKSMTYSIVLIVMHICTTIKLGEGDPFILLWFFLSATCLATLIILLVNIKEK